MTKLNLRGMKSEWEETKQVRATLSRGSKGGHGTKRRSVAGGEYGLQGGFCLCFKMEDTGSCLHRQDGLRREGQDNA